MKATAKIAIGTVAAVLVVLLLRGCVATSYLIPSSGMENTLLRGERILVNKWSYGLRLPLMAWWGYHRWADSPVGKQDVIVFNNPANLSQPVIDRRETFIGRCIGLPGDTLMIDSLFRVAHSPGSPDEKSLYAYPKEREGELDSLLTALGIRSDGLLGLDSARHIRSFSRYEYYLLTQAIDPPCWLAPAGGGHPTAGLRHPLIVPGRGATLRVRPWNIALLRNTLVLHEGRQAEIKGDTLLVDGKPVNFCRFTKDYYWVATDNATSVSGSRLFGLVPKDHLIGRAAFIWLSKEGTGLLDGYRWDRMWTRIR